MSMIDATAVENRRAAQGDDLDAAARAGHDRWSVHPLVPYIAGLVAVAAIGRVLLVPEATQSQPPAVAANAGPAVAADIGNVLQQPARAVDSATARNEPAKKPVQPAQEPDALELAGVEAPSEVGIEAGPAVVAAGSDAGPWDTAVAGQPAVGPEAETGGDSGAVAPASPEPMPDDRVAAAPRPASEPSPPANAPASVPSAIETSAIARAGAPAAVRIARVISDVNMRAGPGNSHPVVGTIARGRSVEVIACRQWCEVIYSGRRGWIYKSFIGP